MAIFIRRYAIADELAYNVLVGIDILYAKDIILDIRNQEIIIRSYEGTRVATIVFKREKVKAIPIRLVENVTI